MAPKQQRPAHFDRLVVIDFEATFGDGIGRAEQEIIEFPAALLDAGTGAVLAEFRRFVRPVLHPTLTAACTELTGIQQGQVDAGVPFLDSLAHFGEWLAEHGLDADEPDRPGATWVPVTCGVWDLRTMLPGQCALIEASRAGSAGTLVTVPVPAGLRRTCDLKKVFRRATGTEPTQMEQMLAAFGLELEGRLHSGIDDVRNIARITAALLARGAPFRPDWVAPLRFLLVRHATPV